MIIVYFSDRDENREVLVCRFKDMYIGFNLSFDWKAEDINYVNPDEKCK